MSAVPPAYGRYEIESEIGDGSMGRVYRAFDPLMKRVVAVKTVKTEYLSRSTATEYLLRFQREAHAAGRLSHPNIVSLFDVGEDYFVMEYLDGLTLQQLLERQPKLPLAEALALLGPLADALDYAHSEGVIHRDIKPANIMVLADARPKLMDFGVARLEESAATSTGHFFGSPSYMAPEQIGGPRVDRRADLFALAVLAFEMITGRRPFDGATITAVLYKVVNEAPPAPRTFDPDLPPVYDDIFRRALHKDPDRRYATAAAFVAALNLQDVDAIFDDLPLEVVPPGPASGAGDPAEPSWSALETHALPAVPRRRGARLALQLGGLLTVLALAAGSAWRLQPSAEDHAFRVEAVPQGAIVWLDGQRMGPAPLRLPGLRPGPHRIRIAMDGYTPAELGFDLPEGVAPPPLRFSLQPIPPPPTAVPEPPPPEPSPSLAPVPARRPARRASAPETPRPLRTRPGALVAIDASVTPPQRIAGDSPRYPEAARRLRLLGSVTVEMLVDEHGVPGEPRVVESAGDVLDTTVVDAVRRWRYEPARRDGVPVKVRWRYRHSFVAP